MGFGGGGGGSGTGVNAHWHNSQTGNGGPLQFKGSVTTGTSMQINDGTEIPAEVLF